MYVDGYAIWFQLDVALIPQYILQCAQTAIRQIAFVPGKYGKP